MDTQGIQHLHDILKGFPVVMLISFRNGKPFGRPMAVANLSDTCELWFFTDWGTEKIEEIENNPNVYVTAQQDKDCYLGLFGTARIESDRDKIAELWREAFRVWFPKGKEDPDLVLIHVIPKEAEYWDNRGFSKLRYAFESAKAYLTGEQPEVREGEEHDEIELNSSTHA